MSFALPQFTLGHVYVTEALTTSANYLYFTIRLAHPEIKTPSHNFTESVRLDVVGLDQAMTWFEQVHFFFLPCIHQPFF
jgi:hypothetical protein